MMEKGMDEGYASRLVQYGWETITEALKHGGITNMMDRLSNPAKIRAHDLSEQLKQILTPLFNRHMDDIMSGHFSKTMMKDWAEDDADLLRWRTQTADTPFETAVSQKEEIPEQSYFDQGILMVAMVKAGVELAYDTMVSAGIIEESAYYESLHEVPLIANLIARKKLYEMNVVISDTAEYGCYLFNHSAVPLLKDFMTALDSDVIGKGLDVKDTGVDNIRLIQVNDAIRSTSVEQVGKKLRAYMGAMKPIF
jgi:ketol-acid reductoisomerase